MNITQIVLMLSSLWTADNASLVYYVWYTSFSMCLYILQFLETANNTYFACFILTLRLCTDSDVLINLPDEEFSTLRYTMELCIPHGFLKRPVLKLFGTIGKSQHTRFQSK